VAQNATTVTSTPRAQILVQPNMNVLVMKVILEMEKTAKVRNFVKLQIRI
jgi:hypothetical protein